MPGQYYDEETGLYYNLNRYYDPKIGRYLQIDPAGDGLNPYVYAAANPVNAIDPDGLCALRMIGGGADIWAGGALIVGAVTGPPGWVLTAGGVVVGSLMVLNGADNLIAGGRSVLTGEYEQAFLEAGIHHYVQNPLAADLLYMGTQLGLGYAGIRVHRAMRAAQLAGAGGTTGATRTNEELVQEIARRAERKIGGTSRVPGIRKYRYARDLLERYQRMYGNRGLEAEISWLNRVRVRYGTTGSTRLDVYDVITGAVYDYKFTINSPAMTVGQLNKILTQGPGTITRIVEVTRQGGLFVHYP